LSEIDGVALAQSVFNIVGAGETETTTATYTIKPADMAAGSFTNTVTATLNGKSYQVEDTLYIEDVDAELSVEKTAAPASDVKAGDGESQELKPTVVFKRKHYAQRGRGLRPVLQRRHHKRRHRYRDRERAECRPRRFRWLRCRPRRLPTSRLTTATRSYRRSRRRARNNQVAFNRHFGETPQSVG